MAEPIWRLVKIERTHLGFEDHGMFTAILHMAWDGGGQGFGLHILSEPEVLDRWIKGIMKTVGVSTWEDIAGKEVYMLSGYAQAYAIRNKFEGKRVFWTSDDNEKAYGDIKEVEFA